MLLQSVGQPLGGQVPKEANRWWWKGGFMPALLRKAPLHDPVGSDNFEIFSKSTKFNSNE